MPPTGWILSVFVAVFYFRTWKYIHQLVKEVNQQQPERRFTTLSWWRPREAWRVHSQLYPSSGVRKQIAWNIALSVVFALGVMFVQWRSWAYL
jgi:hypothetical protein